MRVTGANFTPAKVSGITGGEVGIPITVRHPVQIPEDAAARTSLPSPEALATATGYINQQIQVFNRQISFEVDQNTRRIIVSVIDRETKEVIRQIPPAQVLRMVAALDELLGLVLDETA